MEKPETRRRVVIDLAFGSQPIRGAFRAGGESVEFTGWLDLLCALQRAAETPVAPEKGSIDDE